MPKRRSLEDGYNPLDPAPFIENNPSFKYYTDNINPIYVDNNTGEVWQNNKPKGSIILPDVEIKGRALKHSERKEKYPQEKGLETPMIDPFLLLLGAGKYSGDIIGDLVGEGLGYAAKPLTKIITNKVADFGNYARGHVYYNVPPVGYDHPVQKAKAILKGIASGKKADIENAPWIKNINWDEVSKEYGVPSEYFKQARIDAWRMYNLLPQKYNTFIPSNSLIGAYQPNLRAIKDNPNIHKLLNKNINYIGTDIVNGSGGNVGNITLENFFGDIDDVLKPYSGVMKYKDVWDLHPFSRYGDEFTNKVIRPITVNMANNLADGVSSIGSKLYHLSMKKHPKLGDFIRDAVTKTNRTIYEGEKKLTESVPFRKLDKKMRNFEVSSITGGKPFEVVTEIPFHRPGGLEHTNGKLHPSKLKFGFNLDNVFTKEQMIWYNTVGKGLYIKRNGGIYKPFYK